ncbi:MAG: hypothetical protein PVJ61_00735 [Dehalococcoidia bacterium]|jgi:hypothetical protein
MSKSIVKAACGLLVLVIAITGLAACGPMSEPSYADAMAESALQSMTECDYATHVALYVPEAAETFTEGQFNTGCTQIESVVGNYTDKEFKSAREESGYIVVEYTCHFTDEPDDATATLYFEMIDEEAYIAGFWLASPKLNALSEQ